MAKLCNLLWEQETQRVVELEFRGVIADLRVNSKCDGPRLVEQVSWVVRTLRIDQLARGQTSKLVFKSNQGQDRQVGFVEKLIFLNVPIRR